MKRVAFVAGLLMLAGCVSSETASTPRSIEFSGVSTMTIKDVTAKAQAHCEQYGRDAQIIPDGRADGRATFQCIDR